MKNTNFIPTTNEVKVGIVEEDKTYTKQEILTIAKKLCQRHDNCRKYGHIWDIEKELEDLLK